MKINAARAERFVQRPDPKARGAGLRARPAAAGPGGEAVYMLGYTRKLVKA